VLLQPGEKASWLGVHAASSPVAGWLSGHSHYGTHYLRDLANTMLYEPAAKGWAKSIANDCFAYGVPSMLSGALWKTTEFITHHLASNPADRISNPNLYVADSDQFKPGRVFTAKLVKA